MQYNEKVCCRRRSSAISDASSKSLEIGVTAKSLSWSIHIPTTGVLQDSMGNYCYFIEFFYTASLLCLSETGLTRPQLLGTEQNCR